LRLGGIRFYSCSTPLSGSSMTPHCRLQDLAHIKKWIESE
jgi:hypothetical protein